MIDAGIWGQLPSLINAGIFAAAEVPCQFAGSCSWPTPASGVGAGSTVICSSSISVTVPAGGAKVVCLGQITYIVQVPDSLCAGCHSLGFSVDGTVIDSFTLPAPTSFVNLHASDLATFAALSAGIHTFNLVYFASTTGLGSDFIPSATLQVEVCPL